MSFRKSFTKIFKSFAFKGKSASSSGDDGKGVDGGFAKSKTAGSTSEATELVNGTDRTLVLRDKVGAAYGGTRYKIPGNGRMKVTTLQHTFFKMLAYAIVEEEEGGASPLPPLSPKQQEPKKKKRGVDTKLTIDSDQLADHRQIIISLVGSQYVLKMIPR